MKLSEHPFHLQTGLWSRISFRCRINLDLKVALVLSPDPAPYPERNPVPLWRPNHRRSISILIWMLMSISTWRLSPVSSVSSVSLRDSEACRNPRVGPSPLRAAPIPDRASPGDHHASSPGFACGYLLHGGIDRAKREASMPLEKHLWHPTSLPV